LPGVDFTNLYGPTETTIASSYYTVPSCPENEHSPIPIGKACEGEQLLVLDESLQPVSVGAVGDLYIGGVGLSLGYWRAPEKTKSVFLDHAQHGRIYKTGDLARIGENGLIYLLGRSDSQIKSRGYRIELGEIETGLQGLGVVRECAVVAVDTDSFEGTAICCAYVPTPGVPNMGFWASPLQAATTRVRTAQISCAVDFSRENWFIGLSLHVIAWCSTYRAVFLQDPCASVRTLANLGVSKIFHTSNESN